MPESTENIIREQREGPSALARLIDGVPEAELRRVPGPGKWCVAALLAHLAEAELSASWRYRQMIERPGVELAAFDQEDWARRGRYDAWDPREAIEMFRLLREANLRVLSGLSPSEWESWGTHVERGRTTVAELARHMLGHEGRHIEQIRRILEG